MSFAHFVGVNHHEQSILLGVGLISSENAHTFIWLLRAWLKCMNDCALKAIISDKDHGMKSVIAHVFLNIRHRHCLWYIMHKLPKKLGSHLQFDYELKTFIQSVIYDSQTNTKFEGNYFRRMSLVIINGCKGCMKRGFFGYQFI